MNEMTIGTRGSRLSLVQTEIVKKKLEEKSPGIKIKVKTIKTEGDLRQKEPLDKISGSGVFAKEIEKALLRHEIDMAVHSLKDLPTDLPIGLTIGAVLDRGDTRDVLISNNGLSLQELPKAAVVGTSSLRRKSQILNLRPDLTVKEIRGNVDTRLEKLDAGEYDAVVLASAGISRSGLIGRITEYLPISKMLPAPGQAALAVELREGDAEMEDLARKINDIDAQRAVSVERRFLSQLGGGCKVPIAAYADVNSGRTVLYGAVMDKEGKKIIRGSMSASLSSNIDIGSELAMELLEKGGAETLSSEDTPLKGKRILLTMSEDSAKEVRNECLELGMIPFGLPMIKIEPCSDYSELDKAIIGIENYDWIVFTSQNSLRYFFFRLSANKISPQKALGKIKIAASGKVADSIKNCGVKIDAFPKEHTPEKFLELMGDLDGKRILIPESNISIGSIAKAAGKRGASCDEIVSYMTLPMVYSSRHILDILEKGIDFIIFASPSGVKSLAESVGNDNIGYINRSKLAYIGGVTAEEGRRCGLNVDMIPRESSTEGLMKAIRQHG